MDYAKWLSRKDLEYKDNQLYFSNFNVQELSTKYGTPLYITSENIIRERFNIIKSVLKSVINDYNIHYAVKANANLSVLKILDSEGSFFDCTSQGEIYSCLQAGIPSNKLIYTGNMFTDNDFKFAIGEFGAGHHVHDITAGKEIKFGILDNQIVEAYQKAKDSGFQHYGIHIHIGSGITNVMNYQKATEKYLSIIDKISQEVSIQFDFVDFGGGFGIPYRPSEDPFNFDIYKKLVLKPFILLVKKGNIGEPTIKIEPGRFLTAESTILSTQVNTIKDNGFKKFAGVDSGFNTLIRPMLYGSYHHIIPCVKAHNGLVLKYDIVGPICESGDILGKEREFSGLKEGDFLAILDTGAYGYTMSSWYNSRPRAAEILLSRGNVYKIREAESYDDLIKNQILPDYLK
ncbi:MAG: diaminopimelate decarboxylase [Candidatus Lokiarchaeota archaeon]